MSSARLEHRTPGYYFSRYTDIATELRRHCLYAPTQVDPVWNDMEKQLIDALRALHNLRNLAMKVPPHKPPHWEGGKWK